MEQSNYIQYGCGWCAPRSWRNFDASPTLRFERLPFVGKFYTKNKERFPENVQYGDIVKGLPVEENSCSVVYCSHVLEHLSLFDFRKALENTYGILKKGGVFRFVVPDLEHYIRIYVNDPSDMASHNFLTDTMLGKQRRSHGIISFFQEWLGVSRHLWMWDYKALKYELKQVGFIDIRRAKFGDSADPLLIDVEDLSRWQDCLGVECKKP